MNRLLCGVAFVALTSQLLAGCATSEVAIQTELTRAKAEQMNEVAARPMASANISPVKVKDAVYMGASVSHSDHGAPLPPSLERKGMSLHKGQSMAFQEIANLIAREAKVSVSVAMTTPNSRGSSPVASGASPSGASMSAPTPPQQQQPQRPGSMGGPAGMGSGMSGVPGGPTGLAAGPLPPNFDVNQAAAAILAGAGGGGSPAALPQQQPQIQAQQISGIDNSWGDLGVPGRMRVDYDGPLPGFLDLVATNYNIGWEYVDGQIVFERVQMRSYEIPALPILAKESFSMSSGSSTGSGDSTSASSTGDADQKASTETTYDIQTDIKAALDTIVTDGAYKYNTRTGQVVALASPQVLRRVSQYIKDLNSQLSKQIAINVKVYSVVLQDGDNYQNQIQTALSTSGTSVGYGTGGGTLGTGGALSGVSNSASTAGNIGWAILSPTSRFAGTQGLISALSTKGDVSVVTSASVVAMNGVPVPLQVANTRGYAKKISVTQTTSGLTSTPTASIEPGSVTTGFNLHLLPKVMKDGSLLLQYGMNISELVGATNGFDTFSSNGSSIQLPNVNQRNFIQEAILPNGGTLVLSGFEQVRASAQVSGPITPSLFLLGGSDVSNLRREILVIAITPTLLDATAAANPPAVASR